MPDKSSTCECQVCGARFKNITDHMLHYMREHDDGYKEPHERRKRLLYCGFCSEYTIPSDTLVCPCGNEHWSKTRK